MDDRFKFRIYNKRTEEMLDVRLISYFSTGNICRVEAQNAVGDIKIFDDYKTSIEDIELLQCTGLKDKNENLIYEGDIVEFPNPFNLNKVFRQVVEWKELALTIGYSFTPFTALTVEVIGNIYQDKELLNE